MVQIDSPASSGGQGKYMQMEHVIAGYLRQVWIRMTGFTRDSMGLDRDILVKVKSSQCART